MEGAPSEPAAPDVYLEERILDRGRAPPNRGRLEPADAEAEGDNPFCGDRVHVYARLDEAGRLQDARFEGDGCVISIASTSLLLEHARGHSPKEIEAMDRETLFQLLGLRVSTARVKCAVLGLATLKDALRPRT